MYDIPFTDIYTCTLYFIVSCLLSVSNNAKGLVPILLQWQALL